MHFELCKSIRHANLLQIYNSIICPERLVMAVVAESCNGSSRWIKTVAVGFDCELGTRNCLLSRCTSNPFLLC